MATKQTGVSPNPEQGLALRECAQALVIQDQAQYDYAAEFLVGIKSKMKEVEAAMDPSCKAAHAAWQTALEQKKKYMAPYVDAEAIVKKSISDYLLEQKRIADVAAEEARIAAEKLEERERTKLLKKADKAEAVGDDDAAESLRLDAAMVFVPVVAPNHEVVKAEGVTSTEDFDIDIVDTKKFLTWLIDNMDPITVLSIKTQPIKQYIKLTKITNIPGVHLTKKMTISAKGR